MLFTQLKQFVFRTAVCSVLLMVVFGHSAHAAIKFSHTELIKHGVSSGGQGKDVFVLKAPANVPAQCARFVDADVVYKKRRFGEVTLLTKPTQGCTPGGNACKITASWKHAPAGRLNYRLKVNWNVPASGC